MSLCLPRLPPLLKSCPPPLQNAFCALPALASSNPHPTVSLLQTYWKLHAHASRACSQRVQITSHISHACIMPRAQPASVVGSEQCGTQPPSKEKQPQVELWQEIAGDAGYVCSCMCLKDAVGQPSGQSGQRPRHLVCRQGQACV